MKCPAIYESEIGNIYFYANKSTLCYILDGKLHDWCFLDFATEQVSDKNITHEYLQNTYGEVQSPEHAEFIIELCLKNSISFATDNVRRKYFAINSGKLYFFGTEVGALNVGSEKITIPLPPKVDSNKCTPDFYDLGELPRHFDCVCNKCGGKCCMGQCDKQESSEWPQVGDEVTWGEREIIGILKCVDNGCAWILCPNGKHTQQGVKYLKPPKTPEEELRDELIESFCAVGYETEKYIDYLISKYDIKRKPQ